MRMASISVMNVMSYIKEAEHILYKNYWCTVKNWNDH